MPRDKFTILERRSQSYGQDTPYLPMIDALDRGFRLDKVKAASALHDEAVTGVRAYFL